MFRNDERQNLLGALASLRQHGHVGQVPGSREQKLAVLNLACRRRFIIWRGPALRYQLTRRGERFLERHSEETAPSRHLKFVLATRLAMAAFMLVAIGFVNSGWVERDYLGNLRTVRSTSTTAAGAPAESGSGSGAPTRATSSLETVPASPAIHNRLDPSGHPAFRLPAEVESTAASRGPLSAKAGDNRKRDRVRRVQRKPPAEVESSRRVPATQESTSGNFGFGWNPYPANPWPSRW